MVDPRERCEGPTNLTLICEAGHAHIDVRNGVVLRCDDNPWPCVAYDNSPVQGRRRALVNAAPDRVLWFNTEQEAAQALGLMVTDR